jgi:hypothetical protein
VTLYEFSNTQRSSSTDSGMGAFSDWTKVTLHVAWRNAKYATVAVGGTLLLDAGLDPSFQIEHPTATVGITGTHTRLPWQVRVDNVTFDSVE